MTRVLVLGAGASVSAGYPLIDDLFESIDREARESHFTNLLQAWNTWRQYLENLSAELEILRAARNPELILSLLAARDRKLLAHFISHLHSQQQAVQQKMLSELTSACYLELIRRLQQAAQAPSVVESPLTIRQLATREFKKLRKAIKRAVQNLLGLHQDAIQAERHVRQFLKYSTSVRAGFLAGRMVERQRQRCRNVRKEIKPLFKVLLKRGKKAWA